MNWIGNGNVGSVPNNYHFHYVLTHFISQDIYNYYEKETPTMVGGFILRKAFTEEEIYKGVGYGFHLIIPRPSRRNK